MAEDIYRKVRRKLDKYSFGFPENDNFKTQKLR
jgi:hypothetical protein